MRAKQDEYALQSNGEHRRLPAARRGRPFGIDRAVFVPCYPDMSDQAVDRLVGALAAVVRGS